MINNNSMKINNYKKQNYLRQKQKFFDLVDNIEDEKLKKNIVYQMLKLEKILKE